MLTPADAENHIDKRKFTAPFVCGARNLGEALRRISEGAAMIRTKGEAGTGRSRPSGIHSLKAPVTKSVLEDLSLMVVLLGNTRCIGGDTLYS